MRIASAFAILDVKGTAAGALDKRITQGTRIPVVIRGFVSGVWGRYDGISQEFQVDVESAELAG